MTCQILGTDIVDVEIRGCEGEDTNHERITTELDGAMQVIVATIICSTVVTTLIMISICVGIHMMIMFFFLHIILYIIKMM